METKVEEIARRRIETEEMLRRDMEIEIIRHSRAMTKLEERMRRWEQRYDSLLSVVKEQAS